MRVESIIINNMELLYDTILMVQDQNNCSAVDVKFNNQYMELLDLITVSFNLLDVNMYNYVFLKRKYPNVIKNSEVSYCTEESLIQFGEVSSLALADYGKFINEDVNEKSNSDIRSFMLPLGLQTCSVSVVLSGVSLANLIGVNPVKFFMTATENACVKTVDETIKFLPPNEYNFYSDDNFKKYLVTTFVNGYYKMMLDDVIKTDINSAYAIYGYMTSILPDNNIAFQLCSLSSPFGIIEFNNNENDNIKDMLKQISKNASEMEDKEYNAKHTSFTFLMNTDIASYCKIVELLPSRCVIATEPIINIVGTEYDVNNLEYPSSLNEEFEVRINTKLTSVIDAINNVYGGRDDILKKLALLFPSQRLKYIIKLTCEDANMYLYDLLTGESDSGDITYVDEQVKTMLTDLSKTMGSLLAAIDMRYPD